MKEKPSANPYRQEIFNIIRPLLEKEARNGGLALDFGAGDGWFAHQIGSGKLFESVVPLDINQRKKSFSENVLYDGARIPYPDSHFDLVYAIDVIHHCDKPTDVLLDLCRSAKKHLLIKDHVALKPMDRSVLYVLDVLGNSRFGVAVKSNYQRSWEWFPIIESQGFKLRAFVHPAKCHGGLLGKLTNDLQFVALWSRNA